MLGLQDFKALSKHSELFRNRLKLTRSVRVSSKTYCFLMNPPMLDKDLKMYCHSPTRLACGVLTIKKGYRLGWYGWAVPPSCRDRFPQRSWYQDPDTKILVPRSWYRKNGEPERRSLLVCRGGKGDAGGSGGSSPPVKTI